MRVLFAVLVVLLPAGALPVVGQAPGASEGTVTGQGSVEIKRQADVLRVQVDLLARGKDPKEALAKLKERREAAKTQLAALGADKQAISIGEPAISADTSDSRRQMQMMVMQRMRAGLGKAKKPDKTKTSPPVTVTATLKADLPLKGTGVEEALVAAHQLQEKIKSADLAGMKELEQLKADDEELAEEMAEADMMGMYNQGQPRPGEPVFLFVAKVTEQERDKALAEAFQKAKREAGRLARAAGAELGTLGNLHSSSQSSSGDATNPYDYGRYMQVARMSGLGGDGEESATEAVGAQPGQVSLRISVTASFSLKGGR